MADNSAEPTSAFDGVTVPAFPTTVIDRTDVLLLPRLFLMVALKENLANLQENADHVDLEGFWDRLIEILEEIRQAVSKIEGGSKLEDGIKRAKDVVDTKLVPYLQSLPNVPQMLDSYLPQKGQTWEDFLQGKPEHERKLAMSELDIQDFHDHLPDIVLLYMDQFLKDVNEFRRFITRPELPARDAMDRWDRMSDIPVDITPYSSASIGTISAPIPSTVTPKLPSTIFSEDGKEYYKVVEVYYATDRKLEKEELYKYDNRPQRRPLEYGIVGVSIPSIHKEGVVESTKQKKDENPYKHVLILPEYDRKLRGDKGKFFTILNEDISANLGLKTEGDLLIFIHGYNNTHEGALKQAAQLKFDMDFKGAMVAYSWSSGDSQWGYLRDQKAIENTVQSLKGFLLDIMEKMEVPTRIHLLAHSMGNRAMIGALDLLHSDSPNQIPNFPDPRCPIATVISAAGDDRPRNWENLLAKLKKAYPPNAEGKFTGPLLSVYSSNEDWALKASRFLHNWEFRLGDTNRLFERRDRDPLLTLDDHDAIDATGVKTKPPFGHGYFGDAPDVIKDIHALITKSIRANGRGLPNVQKSGFNFFAFIKEKWPTITARTI